MTQAAADTPAVPEVAARPTAVEVREAYYVWELPVRLTHWLIAASLGVLAVTGIYIGHPFLAVPGEARFRFVMGTVKAIHFWTAMVFTAAVVARLVWMFTGNRWARWDQFLPVRAARLRRLFQVLAYYAFVRRDPPDSVGHNPLAGAAYSLVFALYLVMIATGLSLWSVNAGPGSPLHLFGPLLGLLGGPQTARWIHHIAMWLLLGFVAHHVASTVLAAVVERNGIVDSIVSGYKYLRRDVADRETKP